MIRLLSILKMSISALEQTRKKAQPLPAEA